MTKSKKSNLSPYETEKIALAAFLIAAGRAELIGANLRPGTNLVIFRLSQIPSNDDITDFFGGTATVPALRFFETINVLKSTIYEIRQRNENLRFPIKLVPSRRNQIDEK